MSTHITSAKALPTAPYYILCNDAFMSGWGPCRDLINTCVLPAWSYHEAQRVASYARSRTDQRLVRIVRHKPRLRPGHYYSLMSPQDAPAWYGVD